MVLLSRSISSLWHPKERAYERRQFLQLSEVGKNQPLQVVGTSYGLFSNAMIFQVIPDLLVGVEFWGVWWQAKKLQSAFSGGDESRNRHRFMNRMTINNQEYRTRPIVYKPFQETNKDIASNLTFNQHESHGTPWGDGRDHVAAETGSGRGNDRCFATNRPRLARMKVGSYPCLVTKELVTKENVRLLLSRQSANLLSSLL